MTNNYDFKNTDFKMMRSSILNVDVTLNKTAGGLGFRIAGGVDTPYLADDDGVYVTNVIPGGAAELDGRMKLGDKIISVRD